MVNIVKARKKAKEKKSEPKLSGEPAPSPAPAGAAEGGGAPPSEPPKPEQPSRLAQFVEGAGARHEIVAPVAPEAPEDFAELLTFAIGKETYAVDIEHVVEIVPPRSVTRIPNADSSIVGILSLRGTIVTIIDVRRLLKQEESAVTPDTRVVVTERDGDYLGFTVDRVLRVVKIPAGEIDPQPVAHSSEQDESVRGVFRHAETLTILLDLNKLLDNRVEVPSAS